jgi:hypothetical protein
LQPSTGRRISEGIMHRRFSFGNKIDAIIHFFFAYNTRSHSAVTQKGLLRNVPFIRVTKDDDNAGLEAAPNIFSIRCRFREKVTRVVIKVFDEVAIDLSNVDSSGKWRDLEKKDCQQTNLKQLLNKGRHKEAQVNFVLSNFF